MLSVKHKYPEGVYKSDRIRRKRDLNGDKPSTLLVVTNRSDGKTTNFHIENLVDFHNYGHKFVLLVDHKYQVKSKHLVFTDVLNLYPELGKKMTSKLHGDGIFAELFLDGSSCGYVVYLKEPNVIQDYSGVFAQVERMFKDEFQPLSGNYIPNFMRNLQAVTTTIARGGGKQSREIELVMCANPVNPINPVYVGYKDLCGVGIHKRLLLRPETQFMRGDGWVLQHTINNQASQAIMNNKTYRQFGSSHYTNFSVYGKYLYDNACFIEKPKGANKYLATLVYEGRYIGVRWSGMTGAVYCSLHSNRNCKIELACTNKDHNTGRELFTKSHLYWKLLKSKYDEGILYFDNIETKADIMDIIAVNMYDNKR